MVPTLGQLKGFAGAAAAAPLDPDDDFDPNDAFISLPGDNDPDDDGDLDDEQDDDPIDLQDFVDDDPSTTRSRVGRATTRRPASRPRNGPAERRRPKAATGPTRRRLTLSADRPYDAGPSDDCPPPRAGPGSDQERFPLRDHRPAARPHVNPPSPGPKAGKTGTVAVVLAAGLGTRMKSAIPKVLHPLCGRPMLAYVLDAWASTARRLERPPPDRRLLAGGRGDQRRLRRSSDVRAPGRAARHGRRGRRGAGRRARRRDRDPRPVGRRAAGHGRRPRRRARGAPRGRRRDRPGQRVRRRPGPARARRARRVRHGRADRRGEGRHARGAGRQRGQRRDLRLRCRLAAAPDRGARAVGARPASCT